MAKEPNRQLEHARLSYDVAKTRLLAFTALNSTDTYSNGGKVSKENIAQYDALSAELTKKANALHEILDE